MMALVKTRAFNGLGERRMGGLRLALGVLSLHLPNSSLGPND